MDKLVLTIIFIAITGCVGQSQAVQNETKPAAAMSQQEVNTAEEDAKASLRKDVKAARDEVIEGMSDAEKKEYEQMEKEILAGMSEDGKREYNKMLNK